MASSAREQKAQTRRQRREQLRRHSRRPVIIKGAMLTGVLLVTSSGVTASMAREVYAPAAGDHAPAQVHHIALSGATSGIPYMTLPPPVRKPSRPKAPKRSRRGHLTRSSSPSAAELGIPATVLAAYEQAASEEAKADPGCHLSWQMLAGIGKVESNNAGNGDVSAQGTALVPILGPLLNGTNGTLAIGNSVGGLWGEGGTWARAIGPMQFIPSAWATWGVDSSGGGAPDPENIYDATLAAAHYLCSGGRDLATADGLSSAVWSYNPSAAYVSVVTAWITYYLQGGGPDQPAGIVTTGSGGSSSSQDSSSATRERSSRAHKARAPRPAEAPRHSAPARRRPAPAPSHPAPQPSPSPLLDISGLLSGLLWGDLRRGLPAVPRGACAMVRTAARAVTFLPAARHGPGKPGALPRPFQSGMATANALATRQPPIHQLAATYRQLRECNHPASKWHHPRGTSRCTIAPSAH